MNTSGVNPTYSQRVSGYWAVTCSGSAQTSPADTLCAAYREALENLAPALCQGVLVDRRMESRLHKKQGGFMDDHQVMEVNQKPDSIQKMEQILSVLQTRDDQVFRRFIEWLCDSGSRNWGLTLAEQAGLRGTTVAEQSSGHLEREPPRRRLVVGERIIPVVWRPCPWEGLPADAAGERELVDPEEQREGGRVRTHYQKAIASAAVKTGRVCGTVCGSLPGLALMGLSAFRLRPGSNCRLGFLSCFGLWAGMFCTFALAGEAGIQGARLGAWVGGRISGWLDHPPLVSVPHGGDAMVVAHRKEPRQGDEVPT